MKDAVSAYAFMKSQNVNEALVFALRRGDASQSRKRQILEKRRKLEGERLKKAEKDKKKLKKAENKKQRAKKAENEKQKGKKGSRKKKKKTPSPHPQKLKVMKLAQLQSRQDDKFYFSTPEKHPECSISNTTQNTDDQKDDEAMPDKLGNVEINKAPMTSCNVQDAPRGSNDVQEMPYMMDSRLEGKKCFEYLIHPVTCDRFFEEIWEKRPLLLKRHKSDYYNGLLKMSHIKELIKSHKMRFGKHIDVTSYVDGVRKTHNPPGIAYASLVWDYYRKGCSLRLLNPQKFNTAIWTLNSTLQEFFGSFVGANVYLTPPGSQGFAPHYDDIEAFVLQLEGKKMWKLYKARTLSEVLPRYSSENFSQNEIGQPMLETELEPGDMLYFPRGVIHQAVTPPDDFSLHITLSTSQRNTWGDLLTKMVPRALELAIEDDVDFRQSLPKDYLNILGVVHSEKETYRRRELTKTILTLASKMLLYLPIDAAVDQMGKQFVHDCLPPVTGKNEKPNTICGNHAEDPEKVVIEKVSFEPSTKLKLLRANILRLVIEDTDVRLYHSASNTREYHEEDPQFVDISPVLAPGVEYLIHMYPKCVTVDSLPLETLRDKVSIAKILYDTGLILVYHDAE